MNIFDRYISKYGISFKKAHVFAAACLFVAVKYVEERVLEVSSLRKMSGCDYTTQQLLETEVLVLSRLGFSLGVTTARDFLDILSTPLSRAAARLASHALDYSLLDTSMMRYDPIDVALAAFRLAQGYSVTACGETLRTVVRASVQYAGITRKYGHALRL